LLLNLYYKSCFLKKAIAEMLNPLIQFKKLNQTHPKAT
jgi:hypothetical protein